MTREYNVCGKAFKVIDGEFVIGKSDCCKKVMNGEYVVCERKLDNINITIKKEDSFYISFVKLDNFKIVSTNGCYLAGYKDSDVWHYFNNWQDYQNGWYDENNNPISSPPNLNDNDNFEISFLIAKKGYYQYFSLSYRINFTDIEKISISVDENSLFKGEKYISDDFAFGLVSEDESIKNFDLCPIKEQFISKYEYMNELCSNTCVNKGEFAIISNASKLKGYTLIDFISSITIKKASKQELFKKAREILSEWRQK